MKRMQPSSSLNPAPSPAGDPQGLAFLTAGGRAGKAFNSTWTLAAAGLIFAATAANLLCLSPRWYSSKLIALVYEPTRFVFLTAATGAVAVQIFWAALENKPTAGPIWIARNLSTAWVFLPCYVLLYERNSLWMLAVAALGTLGLALGLRRLLPAHAPATIAAPLRTAVLPSLDGLPSRDSPLLLAFGIAILTQLAAVIAVNDALAVASLPLAIAVFLFAWRWSGVDTRTAQWWTGRHPPLPQAAAAILITSLALIPFQVVGHRFGLYAEHHPPKASEREPDSSYYGIILYPPPAKHEIVAPAPRDPELLASGNAKPVLIPFDGPYWYFKPPFHAPTLRAHIAHGKTTDPNINPRSTDYEPLLMEAHQNLGLPISLACCREIDVALTNADTRPGAITLALTLADSSAPGKPSKYIGAQPIPSSQLDPIPINRGPVKEVLRFSIPRSTSLRQFNEITLAFQLAPRHARAGAKVSIDTFELIPK